MGRIVVVACVAVALAACRPAGPMDHGAVATITSTVDVRGVVLDSRGTPVAGARVTALPRFSMGGFFGWSTCTDTLGRFVLPLPSRDASDGLSIQAPGHLRNVVSLTASRRRGDNRPVAVAHETTGVIELEPTRLEEGFALRARVVDPEGVPVEGWVSVSTSCEACDFEGWARLDALPAGEVALEAGAEGFASAHARVVVGKGLDPEVTLTLGAVVRVQGRVSAAGEVVPEAIVRVSARLR